MPCKIAEFIPMNWSSLNMKEKSAVTALVVSTLFALFALVLASVALYGLTSSAPLIFKAIGATLTAYDAAGIVLGAILVIITAAVLYVVIQRRSSVKVDESEKENEFPIEEEEKDTQGLNNEQSTGHAIQIEDESSHTSSEVEIENKDHIGNGTPEHSVRPKVDLSNLSTFVKVPDAVLAAKGFLIDGQACIFKIGAKGFILIWKDQGKFGYISNYVVSNEKVEGELDYAQYLQNEDFAGKLGNPDTTFDVLAKSDKLNRFEYVKEIVFKSLMQPKGAYEYANKTLQPNEACISYVSDGKQSFYLFWKTNDQSIGFYSKDKHSDSKKSNQIDISDELINNKPTIKMETREDCKSVFDKYIAPLHDGIVLKERKTLPSAIFK